jgi:UDP-glucose 4-epimerase
MSNVLVIGGAGFIGSHLTEILVNSNHNVVVLDNLYLGKEENLEKIKDKIKFHNLNFRDKDEVERVIKDNQIEYIFHFGGYSSGPMFDNNETEAFKDTIGFTNLLEISAKNNVKRVLYASSSSIYGDVKPQKEDVKVAPPNFYALTKFTMEHISRLFYDNYGIESIGFRFFSVYGKNEKHKGRFANLISQFLWNIQDNEEIVIYGDGSQTRDFTYVVDLCNAIIKGMETDSENAKANVYNIGTSETYTVNEMIGILEELTGKKSEKKCIENPIKNYVQDTKADTTKIKTELNFEATYSLRDGIKDILGV